LSHSSVVIIITLCSIGSVTLPVGNLSNAPLVS